LRRWPLSGSAFQLNCRSSPTVRSFDLPRIALQLALATDLSACRPASLRLASPANLPAQPSHRPATCAACRSSGLPSDSSPACAFDSVFQLYLPVDLRLAPSFNLPAPPSNLTSDSHRPPVPSALPSANLRLAPPTSLPALPGEPNVRLRLLHLRLSFPARLRRASSTGLSARPLNSTPDSSATASFRRCLPADMRLAPPIHLPALPADTTSVSSETHL